MMDYPIRNMELSGVEKYMFCFVWRFIIFSWDKKNLLPLLKIEPQPLVIQPIVF